MAKIALSECDVILRQLGKHGLGRFGLMRLHNRRTELRRVEHRFADVVKRSVPGTCPTWYCAMGETLTAKRIEMDQVNVYGALNTGIRDISGIVALRYHKRNNL